MQGDKQLTAFCAGHLTSSDNTGSSATEMEMSAALYGWSRLARKPAKGYFTYLGPDVGEAGPDPASFLALLSIPPLLDCALLWEGTCQSWD